MMMSEKSSITTNQICRGAITEILTRGWRRGIIHEGQTGVCMAEAIMHVAGNEEDVYEPVMELFRQRHVGVLMTGWNDAHTESEAISELEEMAISSDEIAE